MHLLMGSLAYEGAERASHRFGRVGERVQRAFARLLRFSKTRGWPPTFLAANPVPW